MAFLIGCILHADNINSLLRENDDLIRSFGSQSVRCATPRFQMPLYQSLTGNGSG